MIIDNENNPNRKTLICQCQKCNKIGRYDMSEAETKLYEEYLIKNRSMGLLINIFPKIPAWISSGCLDNLKKENPICPDCQK